MNKRVFYTHSVKTSFVRKDVGLLEENYSVRTFYFNPNNKFLVPFQFMKQFFVAGFLILKSDIVITQFAGYQSFLPALFAKIYGKPSLIILGGTDCVSFPSIRYGNFFRPGLKQFTAWSLRLSTHLSPVHKSLVKSKYTYTNVDYPEQGYLAFCPKVKAPFTELFYGYDSNQFRDDQEKIPNSFITVGFLDPITYFRKGIDLIIMLANEKPDYTFTIVGGTIADLPVKQVPSNVTLVDSVSYEELKDLYAKHEFYFQLSICEGFPSAICEAMLCGCIPIGSDVAAIPEIIGDTGFVLKHKDNDDLLHLIEKATTCDKENHANLARNRITTNFPLDTRNKLIELVESMFKK
jgi:glycosyltransferase involved in cell wall biosynthesis